MTVNKSFVLLVSLMTSGFLLCTTQHNDEEVKGRRGMMESGVGIHLGTTYSSVAVFKHPGPRRGYCMARRKQCAAPLSSSDVIEVVTNERGSRTTPSCVAFTDSGVLIGEPAKDQAAINSERTICGINGLIGKRFDDPDVQSYIQTLPYKVVNIENKPHVEVKFKNGETKVFSPEEICAFILGKMKEIAEAYMGNEIELAYVLVHPRFFNEETEELQRSIVEAGKIAGLKIGRVSNSELAAVLARRQWAQQNLRVLVYNLGGTAFDVRLLDQEINDGLYELISARGDMRLGGQAFDMRVVDYFINLIKSKYNKDISKDLTALGKLKTECEKAKISLSNSDRVMINIESLADGIMKFEEPLTRETFEELNMDLFNKSIELVRDVMNEGGVEKIAIDEIVLVGGNARIPKIQKMLKELVGREFLKDVNPDEALAFAATHLAGIFTGRGDGRADYQVSNSLSVGIETIDGIMTPYVAAGGYLPTSVSRYVTTYHDEQTSVEIKVFEGFRQLTKYCHYLGTLELSDLPPAPRGVPKIKVKVEVDLNSNIRVTAEHEASRRAKTITIPVGKRYNTIEKIKQVDVEYHELYKEDIVEKSKVVEAIKMCMPQASMEFAVVNTYDFGAYF